MNLIDAANGAGSLGGERAHDGRKSAAQKQPARGNAMFRISKRLSARCGEKYVFAEACLDGLEPLLSLPVLQGEAGSDELPEDAEIHCFY